MTWRRYLQSRTRNEQFLWRMVIAILLAGIVLGLAADAVTPAWIHLDDEGKVFEAASPAEPDAPPGQAPEPKIPHYEVMERLAAQGHWLALWWAIPPALAERWSQVGAATLASLTGFCWLAFSMQAIQPHRMKAFRWLLPTLGVGLGVFSIWINAFFLFWQEARWHVGDSSELQAGLRDNLLGVGLREELAKFLCFLPLLVPVVRRRDELAALVVAGAVGIGFGMTENINYIAGTLGTGTIGRLMVPLPLHMCLTGLLGLAAYRACVWPRECALQFIAMFVIVVMAHGMYDALLTIEVFSDYAFLSMGIFLALVYQFFHEMRPKQALQVEPISLTANFLFCISTVAAATFVYLSAAIGAKTAADALVGGIVGEALMVYVFLREMPETMVTV